MGIICQNLERSKFYFGVDFLKFGALQIFTNDMLFSANRYSVEIGL